MASSPCRYVFSGHISVAEAASLRRLARSHPLWMYRSCPSGRTSVRFTSRSASSTGERIQRSTLPEPSITRSSARTADSTITALPAAGAFQS